MLSKLNSPKMGYISRLLLLPLLAVLFFAFVLKTKSEQPVTKLSSQYVVVIDAGHGFVNGVPNGAKSADGYSEDEYSLALANAIAQLNANNQIKIVLTRNDENNVNLKDRIEFSAIQNADLLISLHANYAVPGKGEKENPLRGIEAYVPNKNETFASQSTALATYVLKSAATIINPNRGVKQRKQGIWMIENAPCPAVLLECGFLTNKEDLKIIKDANKQKDLAKAILRGIEGYLASSTEKANFSYGNQNNRDLTKSDTVIGKNDAVIFDAQKNAVYPGGEKALNLFINRNIEQKLSLLNLKAATKSFELTFFIEKDGTVKDVFIKGSKQDEVISIITEAVSKMPKWEPAVQNGIPVKYAYKKIVSILDHEANNKLSDSNIVTIANQSVKILYIGIENVLIVNGGKVPQNKVVVSIDNGSIKKKDANTWVAYPVSPGTAVVTISKNENGKLTQLMQSNFTVKNVPSPSITLAGSKSGRVAAENMKQAQGLIIEDGWEITQFTIYLTGRNYPKPIVKVCKGSGSFNKEVQELIAEVTPGTTIVFDNVVAQLKGKQVTSRLQTMAFSLY